MKYIETFNENNEHGIIEWISMKLGRNIGKRIGDGLFSVVYEFGDMRAIRFSDVLKKEYIELENKTIPHIVRIYQNGSIKVPKKFIQRTPSGYFFKLGWNTYHSDTLYYTIMERVYRSFKFVDAMDMIDITIGYYIEEHEDYNDITKFGYLYDECNSHDVIQWIYDSLQGDLDPYKFKYVSHIFADLVVLMRSLSKKFEWRDIHSAQFGQRKNGELVAFDIDGIEINDSYELKNIIKEKGPLD